MVNICAVAMLLTSIFGILTLNTYALDDCTKPDSAGNWASTCPCYYNPGADICREWANKEFSDTVNLVVDILFFGIGIVCVVMIVVGGFRYTASRGESKNIESAKKTIMGAIIGLVIVIVARTIVAFVVENVDPGSDITDLIPTILDIIFWALGICSVIMILYGGLRFIMSRGDSKKVGDAKNTIMYAIIGLVVAILALALTNWVVLLLNWSGCGGFSNGCDTSKGYIFDSGVTPQMCVSSPGQPGYDPSCPGAKYTVDAVGGKKCYMDPV